MGYSPQSLKSDLLNPSRIFPADLRPCGRPKAVSSWMKEEGSPRQTIVTCTLLSMMPAPMA
jgi:hypothetical protein